MSNERAIYIQSLRDCADFLEQHPAVKLPVSCVSFNAFVDTKEELAAQARLTSWEKRWSGEWFSLSKTFGVVTLEINADRSLVCRRVVTGTREVPAKTEEVVEWVCEDPAVLA